MNVLQKSLLKPDHVATTLIIHHALSELTRVHHVTLRCLSHDWSPYLPSGSVETSPNGYSCCNLEWNKLGGQNTMTFRPSSLCACLERKWAEAYEHRICWFCPLRLSRQLLHHGCLAVVFLSLGYYRDIDFACCTSRGVGI